MNKFSTIIFGCLSIMTIIPVPLHALETPKAGSLDRRVKSVLYHPEQVVRLIGHYGYATHIEFSPVEKVEHIAMGDSQAWEVAPTAHHIFLKPIRESIILNLKPITLKSNRSIPHRFIIKLVLLILNKNKLKDNTNSNRKKSKIF
jgi:type IV secretion system protein VirB9